MLADGDYTASRFTEYGDEMRRGIEAMRRLVYSFYDQGFSFGEFAKQHPSLRGDLTDCLIGNLEHDFEPMFEAIGKFAAIPAPLEHGRPLTSEPRA